MLELAGCLRDGSFGVLGVRETGCEFSADQGAFGEYHKRSRPGPDGAKDGEGFLRRHQNVFTFYFTRY